MKQTCKSQLDDLEPLIRHMLKDGTGIQTILHEIMRITRGTENPLAVVRKIGNVQKNKS